MTIDYICEKCIVAIREKGYNESTIFNYEGIIRRFKKFCEEEDVTDYSSEIGRKYADAVISPKTGRFSKQRYFYQGRFFRLIDSYYRTGIFDFNTMKKGKIQPDNPIHQMIYSDYRKYLLTLYDNQNTISFYEYGMYCLLQYLNVEKIEELEDLTPELIIKYLQQTKMTRKRGVLCELRGIFRYLRRTDLAASIAGIRAPRINRLIPVLTEVENDRLEQVIREKRISYRDAAIVIIGLSCGIRACDLIKLKLSDIDWENETITFKQSKTGNQVCLPLTVTVGNAIIRYLAHERPAIKDDTLFLRSFAPYEPFRDHCSLYCVVSRVFKEAEISKDNRIFGMHMLRHNAASTMVKNEVPIETIAAILGHSTPDTTDIYITTDVERLKLCVLPMNGISKEVYSCRNI